MIAHFKELELCPFCIGQFVGIARAFVREICHPKIPQFSCTGTSIKTYLAQKYRTHVFPKCFSCAYLPLEVDRHPLYTWLRQYLTLVKLLSTLKSGQMTGTKRSQL